MGKYMRKARMAGEVAVMEVSPQSTLGVRTRARTLALQRLQGPSTADSPDSASYLQLRSRRLEKPPAVGSPRAAAKEACKGSVPNARFCAGDRAAGSVSMGSGSMRSCSVGCDRVWEGEEGAAAWESLPDGDGGVEVSFGENVLDIECRERDVRETTPCSLIRVSENVPTPGSTTRRTDSSVANRRMQRATCLNIPTTQEMEEFFSGAEQLQQRLFSERYNYDPVNDCPLPGRYDWVSLDC